MAAVQAQDHGRTRISFTFLAESPAGAKEVSSCGDFVLARKVLCLAAEHRVVQFSRQEFSMRDTSFVLFLTVALSACNTPAPEKPATPPPAAAAQASAPQGPRLMPGMGNHHHPIATSSPEAQRFFDQGVDLVFGFNHEEAVRSFQRAAELDPKSAMPHWGIAWALGPNYNLDVDDDRAKQANAAMAEA